MELKGLTGSDMNKLTVATMQVDALRKQVTDAQATIAALQDTIMQMGGQAAVLAKDAMAAKEQVAALQARVRELESQHEDLAQRNRILRHRPDLPIERTEFHDQFAALQSQLAQRTAELEAANKLIYKKNCELGRAETINNDLQAELERARGERT